MSKRPFLSKIQAMKISPHVLHSSTSSSISPSYYLTTLIAYLQQCAVEKDLKKGQQIHAQLLRSGLHASSLLSTTSLINMYAKCNRMGQALLVFNNTPAYGCNVFTYNAIISGFVSNGFAKDGLAIYKEMRWAGILPDKFTVPCLVKGCCEVLDVFEVKKLHGLVFKLGLNFDVFVGSALVNSYLKFELMEQAHDLFNEMPERDTGLWNSMLNGCAQTGQFVEALGVFRRMSKEGVLINGFTVTGVLSVYTSVGDFDNGRVFHGIVIKIGFDSGISVCNALIDMYGKCKCVGGALEIFETMEEKDMFSWNSIISIMEECGDLEGALRYFDRMLGAGFRPDLVTITTVLPACSHLGALMLGKEIHGYTIVNGLAKGGESEYIDTVQLSNTVMDMYAKCGSMRDAHLVFDKMSSKDVASWNIMIMGYGMHGYGSEALVMFSLMCDTGVEPNEITFVGILSACSHAGFVNQGHEFLGQMELKYGVVPKIEHYGCVIDMLGRAGQVEEAYKLALTMPVEVNPVVWRALLSACQLHGNTNIAEIVARRVLELDPGHCGNYVLMSNVYVAAGQYEEVLDVRHIMRQQNLRKTPGCSWIELLNGTHTFINGDRIHPEAKSIYAELHLLTTHLCEHASDWIYAE